jgi:hypothetical protein
MPGEEHIKPAGYSEAKWRLKERAVKKHCRAKARKHGWSEERTNRCIYGTLRNVAEYIKASRKRESNLRTHTGAKV